MKPSQTLAFLSLAASLAALLAACGPGTQQVADDDDDGGLPPGECLPMGDDDADGIRNETEGCRYDPPRDTDGDGQPNYQDPDSDGDGVNDRFEDRNGDGQLGQCTNTCLEDSGCLPDEHCLVPDDQPGGLGYCVSFACLDGETSPTADDTDGDGTPDHLEGTWVCNPPDESHPQGLKEVKYVDSSGAIPYSTPNWRVALEMETVEQPVAITSATSFDSAFVFDLPAPDAEVAGFLASRPVGSGEADAVAASQHAVQLLDAMPSSTVAQRASGTHGTSLDGQDTVLATTLVVTASAATDATAVRAEVVRALLGRAPADVVFPTIGWSGAPATQFIVVFQTLHRTEAGQVVFMGGVTALADFEDPARRTGFIVDDLANGTALTQSGNGEAIECEQFLVSQVPEADIIWVLDQSGSMDEDRANVATNASTFFNRAVTAGLDFRMGVTDMNDTSNGIFATRQAGSSTGDRWLLPGDLAAFQAAVNDPSGPDPADGGSEHGLTQGEAAIDRHMPRNDGDPAKLRGDAQLVVIYVTDERAEELEDAGIVGDGDSDLTATQRTQIAAYAQPYIDQLLGEDGVAHLIGVPEPSPACSSGGEVAAGYLDVVAGLGGQFGSICQTDLGATIDAIIDDVVGAASPVVLEWVPISLTIAVSRNGMPVPRSRVDGFDFRASSNSIIFNGQPFDPAHPSEIVISYRRWEEQVQVE